MAIPVANYIRMSTDKEEQEASPDRQRETARRYCESKNYTIVAEYIDEGISGSTLEQVQVRPPWHHR